jgi:alanine racemase
VIQTGFADGFPRPWYDGGYVIYMGKPYPIAGRVCMDQLMVDFGDENVTVGDEVLLFGENGKDSLRMEEISQHIQTTPYVLATNIHGRTERIYLK